MKCMVTYQFPTCDMHFVHCKRCVDYYWNSLHFNAMRRFTNVNNVNVLKNVL